MAGPYIPVAPAEDEIVRFNITAGLSGRSKVLEAEKVSILDTVLYGRNLWFQCLSIP